MALRTIITYGLANFVGGQLAYHHRADDEAQAHRRTDQAEALGALFLAGDVGDIGGGGRDRGAGAGAIC